MCHCCRVQTFPMGSNEADSFGMEVISLCEGGSKIQCYQGCSANGKHARQLFVGARASMPDKL